MTQPTWIIPCPVCFQPAGQPCVSMLSPYARLRKERNGDVLPDGHTLRIMANLRAKGYDPRDNMKVTCNG